MDSIPAELKARRQWLMWYYNQDGEKIPVGKSNEPQTWKDFKSLKGDKFAFVISADDPYTGVDLDDCIVDGVLTELATEILAQFAGVAYAEVSPSGTGIKLLTKASKPVGTMCQAKGKGIECYDHARFWTMTGQVIDGFNSIGNGKDAVNWLCAKYLTPERVRQSFSIPTKSSSKGVEERAMSYVDAADLAGEGQRNNSAFRLAGNLAAIVGDVGDRLSEDSILEFMHVWNARLSVPMDDREIQKVVRSAMKNGVPREDKLPGEFEHPEYEILPIDWECLNNKKKNDDDEPDDEEFCASLVPQEGLLRMVFDFYGQVAYRRSVVMGLAVGVSLCETIFGRRIRSHTDMRTNDYNVILATTGSGKEACESTITKIMELADTGSHFMVPPDVQSGNGLMKALSVIPVGIWICDEFGKVLQAVLDKKGNQHIKNIGNHLLKLYGKSGGTYGGAAHSDGVRNKVVQPHLCVLGLATGSSVFDTVATDQVSDGLLGRIAFWPVQDRPDPKDEMTIAEPSGVLIECVKQWLEFAPGGNLSPTPETIKMSDEAKQRWNSHSWEINERMKAETELRAAIWSRVAARSMKLALVHRAARIDVNPITCNWDFVQIEREDVDWAVKLSNWLARKSCSLIRETIFDKSGSKAKTILAKALEANPDGVNRRAVLRAFPSITAGDLQAAADELGLSTDKRQSKAGRPSVWYLPKLTDE